MTLCWSITDTCTRLVSMEIAHFFIHYSLISPGCSSSTTSNRLLLWIASCAFHGDVVDGICNQIVLFTICDSVRNIIKSELVWLP